MILITNHFHVTDSTFSMLFLPSGCPIFSLWPHSLAFTFVRAGLQTLHEEISIRIEMESILFSLILLQGQSFPHSSESLFDLKLSAVLFFYSLLFKQYFWELGRP
jgi:hypothetical protein